MIKSPSMIKKENFEKSLSDSSILIYNQNIDLFKNSIKRTNKSFKNNVILTITLFSFIYNVNNKIYSNSTKDNKKISKLNKIKPSNNNNSIIKKFKI